MKAVLAIGQEIERVHRRVVVLGVLAVVLKVLGLRRHAIHHSSVGKSWFDGAHAPTWAVQPTYHGKEQLTDATHQGPILLQLLQTAIQVLVHTCNQLDVGEDIHHAHGLLLRRMLAS